MLNLNALQPHVHCLIANLKSWSTEPNKEKRCCCPKCYGAHCICFL
uniref:Uncharacterized protein n=1 Tax=Anguilla anguilla TaxID=7936 RepID=A0A0E9W1G7_ANGAN